MNVNTGNEHGEGEKHTVEQNTITEERLFAVVQGVLSGVFKVEKDTVTPESLFVDDLRLDSLDHMDILFRLQRGLNIAIPFSAPIFQVTNETNIAVSNLIDYLKDHPGIKIVDQEDNQ